jgi:hypothetical protein
MKHLNLTLIALLFALQLTAQAPIPTAWNCDLPIPTGWTHSWGNTGNQFYSATQQVCEGATSARLDNTGEYIEVYTATQPGRVVYSILGTGTSSPWQGTFKVQESTNGSSWTDLKTYTTGDLPQTGPCNYDSVLVTNTNTKYVRFYFANKVSGYNVAIDDIKVREPLLSNPKIKVEQNSQAIVNGGYSLPFNSPVSTTTPVNFTLRNPSLSTLTITSITFSGPHAADFSLAAPTLPASIPSQGNQTMTINFTPSASGTRIAQVIIQSNDAYGDNTYVINLYAIGGNLATEPSAAATNLTFPINKTYRVITSFTNTTVDHYGGYLVLRSEGAPVSDMPVDGTQYSVGQTIGNAKIVYLGKGGNSGTTSFWARWTKAATTYHYAVVPFNGGSSNFVNYRTGDALTGSVTTPNTMVSPTEYSSVDPSSPSFISQLHAVVNPHTPIFYSNYRSTMIEGWAARDTFVTIGPNTFNKVFNCVYSGTPVFFNLPFDFTATGTSREHTFPHSWMPTFPADNPEKPEYNDQHNLYPTIQANVNDARCNYPLGEVVTPIIISGDGKMGLDSAGNRVYEPADKHKGAAARAMFYMTICYNTVSGNSWNLNASIGEVCANSGSYTINYPQNQQLLKNWHFAYPPTNVDISRNDYLDSLQGNRNPFVDNPDWVCYIDFSNMTYIANPTIPCTTSTTSSVINIDDNAVHFTIYPNPSQGVFTVNIYSESSEVGIVKMFDMTGKLIMSRNISLFEGNNSLQVDDVQRSGVYLIEVITSLGRSTKRIIIE